MGGSKLEITKDLTIPKLFVHQCKRYWDKKVAMREKEFGIWRPYTWKDYYENVKYLSLGLIRLGLEKGDKVAMIGDNRPEGLWAEMAAICAGGIGVWLFQDCMMDEVKYIVDHSDAKFFVGETQEEVDKALAIKDDCPKMEWILWDDPKGMRNYNQDFLMSLKKVQELGRELDREDPELFERRINEGHGDDICLLFYTSGTTALPKGALLSHWNMLTMGKNLMAVDPCYDTDDFVSYLPFAWIGEQMMSISCGLQVGYTLNFPEEPETALQNLREIGPHVMFAPPRLYEGMTRQVQVKYIDATWIKRKCYEFATKVGYKIADLKFEKQPVPWYLKILGWIAYITVQKKLKDHLGMSRLRHAYTGGAAMGPDHFRFFHALGVNLKQIYGQTEIAGISIVHRDGDVKFDTVGTPLPETEVRITEDGEIISRSPSVFQGYYKNEEATRKTLVDGWLYSGDRGFIDEDGHLVVFDRSKDVMTLSDGRPFSPQYLETRLKFSPYIQEVWVIGDKREYVTAVMCIDYAVVGKWADDKKITYTSYHELSQKPEVYDLVQKQIEEANKDLPTPAKIRKFVNLYKVFDADDEELTRTSKLRRAFVENRYRDIVDALYSDTDSVHMDTTITYEDGREQRIKTDLRIQKVED
ncbi:MAG: AMP-binding protein [Deltaproteobacteria bacterium]|nr:AMP-binding protein [Deltaproteobacteria bacterium]MBW2016472.1 AMP-binding protein [Deltaproteobacteria bacterium]MBW2128170.1 AMP-binding protein [Deltaproteobacteria bacterium]MBW2302851.1 AMP-binding protein [Deltaproteobacteria bacterium]